MTGSGPAARKPLPGGPLRRLAARVLPHPVKQAVKKRLTGTRWFPPPPVRTARPPAPRKLVVGLPDAPGGGPTPAPLSIECPKYMFIPYKLEESGLGAYEPFGLDCFLALVEAAPPGAVFDIGANVGLYGLLASAYSDRVVHCFEPAPDTAGVARATAAANGLDVTVAEIALGNDTGRATLYLSDSTDSSNSLNPDFRPHSGEIDVPVETIDDYVARTGVVPSLIKIDTETTEPEVLAGAVKTIRDHRPWIMTEVLWSLVEDRLHDVMDEYGYSYYHLNGPGPREAAERIVGDSTWTYYMFLMAPEPVNDAFWDRMNDWRAALDRSTISTPDTASSDTASSDTAS